MVQNLSRRIFFQEKVKFLKSGIWFRFYASSNKDTFFYSPITVSNKENLENIPFWMGFMHLKIKIKEKFERKTKLMETKI